MNRISVKLLSVLAIIFFIAVIPIAVFATNEDIFIVATTNSEAKQEYIIYIKGMSKPNFKYAFTTNAKPEEMDLSYINSISDLEENQVAFLDAATYEKIFNENQTIYMWAKDEEENLILKGIQLDLSKVVTKENIDNVETLTKRIEVKIAESEEEYNKLMSLAEQIRDEYDKKDMYEKIQFGLQFNELYSKVISEAKWQEVEDLIIEQPEESVAGDQYIVLLKKVDEHSSVYKD